jgi:hypothetical protein
MAKPNDVAQMHRLALPLRGKAFDTVLFAGI